MTTLNKPTIGKNTFCGPAVLSVFTGKSTDDVEKLVNGLRNRLPTHKVGGMYLSEISVILSRHGLKVKAATGLNSSLFMFLTMSKPGKYILQVPGHFVVVEITPTGERFFLDNHTRVAISGSSSARLGQKVIAGLQVFPAGE